jgi:transposase
LPPDPTGESPEGRLEVKEFGTMTAELQALSDWLAAAGVTHVAIESTGEFWKPVYNLLEGTFAVVLVNASHVKNVPGRKTDKADARWLAKLPRHGLLQASFIPPAGQRDVGDLTRYRTRLVQERGREVNRVHGVLERANIKLAGVAPGNDTSAGKQRSGKTRKGNRPLRTALVQLAHAAAHTKRTYLSALYQRLVARRGRKRAIMAVAHSILVSAFHMVTHHQPYQESGANYFDELRRQHVVDPLTRRIERLGYRVSLEPVYTA